MNKFLPLLPLISFLTAFSLSVKSAELDRIGTFDFPNSGSPEAQEHFLLGVGYLHSFGMTQAQAEFKKAQELDPDFALAYWGEAFTYQHPFFGPKSEGPGEALMRLGRTSDERLAKAPTDKEKGFIKAAEAYALTLGDMPERRTAWMNAMAELYDKYPLDDEVKTFYAVSMLSGATAAGAMRERINMRAGALAMEVFKDNDNHPGAAHYVIHAFDDPVHAPVALEAAYKYADIAPAVSHARHMPTHIFIQHGKWDEVAQWNESAYNVARELWKSGDAVGEQNHSTDWGQYGDLQLGDIERSKLWIRRAEQTLSENPDDGRSRGTLSTVRARHTIETQNWALQELNEELSPDELLALGLSAVNLGETELAQRVTERLDVLAADSENNLSLKVSHMEIAAMSMLLNSRDLTGAMATSQQQQAITLLREAVELTNGGRLPSGAANPLKPVHELTGEVLLGNRQPEEAALLFEESLLRMPNRPLSLLGAARAYKQAGDKFRAAEKYTNLLAVWSDDSQPAVQEAKTYLGF
jgi:tetratricopeptide (TPR) repeat protein